MLKYLNYAESDVLNIISIDFLSMWHGGMKCPQVNCHFSMSINYCNNCYTIQFALKCYSNEHWPFSLGNSWKILLLSAESKSFFGISSLCVSVLIRMDISDDFPCPENRHLTFLHCLLLHSVHRRGTAGQLTFFSGMSSSASHSLHTGQFNTESYFILLLVSMYTRLEKA